jgi:hypothetical protein
MSASASRWLLWLGLVVALPVPILFLGPGLVPAARLLMLGGIGIAVMLLENARGAVGPLTAVLLGQGVLYLGLLWLAAHLASRLLGRLPPRRLAAVTLAVLAAGLTLASTFAIYHTPFGQTAHASWLHVFE